MNQDQKTINALLAIGARLQLGDAQLAALVGIAPHTARVISLTRSAPRRASCMERIRAFVELNRDARTRSDVRLSDEGT